MPIIPFKDRFESAKPYTGSASYNSGKVLAIAPRIGSSAHSAGRIGLHETGSNAGNTSAFNRFRQGVSVITPTYVFDKITPVVTTRGLPERSNERINFQIEDNVFGQPSLFSDPPPDAKTISAFEDILGKFSPVTFIKDSKKTQMYPNVLDSTSFMLPDLMDGVIEPLDIRRSITNTSIDSPREIHRIKSSLMTGNWLGDEKGSTLVTSLIPNRTGSFLEYFEDAQDRYFPSVSFAQLGYEIWQLSNPSISSNKSGLAMEGYISSDESTLPPFSDIVSTQYSSDYISGSIKIDYSLLDNKNISDIGSRYYSSTCGFTFTKNNVSSISGIRNNTGVDSIAYGGLIK